MPNGNRATNTGEFPTPTKAISQVRLAGSPSRRAASRGFTLVEICLSLVLIVLVLAIATPSLTGIFAERRLKESFETFNKFVLDVQHRSLNSHQTYRMHFDPENHRAMAFVATEFSKKVPGATEPKLEVNLDRAGKFTFVDSSARRVNEWTFWPTGNCEPRTVGFSATTGQWSAAYHPLTAQPVLTMIVH